MRGRGRNDAPRGTLRRAHLEAEIRGGTLMFSLALNIFPIHARPLLHSELLYIQKHLYNTLYTCTVSCLLALILSHVLGAGQNDTASSIPGWRTINNSPCTRPTKVFIGHSKYYTSCCTTCSMYGSTVLYCSI